MARDKRIMQKERNKAIKEDEKKLADQRVALLLERITDLLKAARDAKNSNIIKELERFYKTVEQTKHSSKSIDNRLPKIEDVLGVKPKPVNTR